MKSHPTKLTEYERAIKEFKLGDMVRYKGDLQTFFRIHRIDHHVYPICLGGGLRCKAEDIVLLRRETFLRFSPT